MATDWNDPNHPNVQNLAGGDPSQIDQEHAQQAVKDLHDQIAPDQLKPILEQHYSNMDPAQMQAIIEQLKTELAQQQHPETQQAIAIVDPQTVTPQQAAELHAHAHEFHPSTVEKVVIAGAGAAAVGGLAFLAARHFTNQNKGS
jgi:hypothetical protein